MPVTKTAKKALRQNIKRRKQNLAGKSAIKVAEKKIKKILQQKDTQGAKALLPGLYKAIDKATKIGIIKKNKASRIKSRMTKKTK